MASLNASSLDRMSRAPKGMLEVQPVRALVSLTSTAISGRLSTPAAGGPIGGSGATSGNTIVNPSSNTQQLTPTRSEPPSLSPGAMEQGVRGGVGDGDEEGSQ